MLISIYAKNCRWMINEVLFPLLYFWSQHACDNFIYGYDCPSNSLSLSTFFSRFYPPCAMSENRILHLDDNQKLCIVTSRFETATTVSEYLSMTQFILLSIHRYLAFLNPMHNKSQFVKVFYCLRTSYVCTQKTQMKLKVTMNIMRSRRQKFNSILIHVWWLVKKLLNWCSDLKLLFLFRKNV